MAIFSDIDWMVILAVGGFLLFGQGNGEALRQLGRWYGRLVRLKRELLSELTEAADLPPPTPGRPYSLRQVLLEGETMAPAGPVVPAAVTAAPRPAAAPALATVAYVPSSVGPDVWSMARPGPELDGGVR